MVEINAKNVLLVLGTIGGIILLIVGIYLNTNVGGLIVGTTTNVATSGQINVSEGMQNYLNSTETEYIGVSQLTTGNVTLTISIFAIVIILILFGVKFGAGMFGGGGKGGTIQ